jgi:uncharacterized iron-regulated protein
MRGRIARLIALVLLCGGAMNAGAQSGNASVRVYVRATGSFADTETMLADVARADVLFIGEQHGHVPTHRFEAALLDGVGQRRGQIVLALEMFERDVQESLDAFLAGDMSEPVFMRDARAWPRYATDYKPLVDVAAARNWPVVAANVPRSIAAEVARLGLDALKRRPDAERALFAREVKCTSDSGPLRRLGPGSAGRATSAVPSDAAQVIERYYLAQCLKDETIAESIARAYASGARGGKRPLIVSVNGAFHTDFGGGLLTSTRRRLPDKRVVVVSLIPVEALEAVAVDARERDRADYVVFLPR